MLQEENVVLASDGHVAGHARQSLLQPSPIFFQRADGGPSCGIQLGRGRQREKGFELARHLFQARANVLQLMDG